MSIGALTQLNIEYLRGSVKPFSLLFEPGKRLTVIYGENGTGKSTICDAFEFLGNGRVGSLENRGLGKTNRYWCSLGRQLADVSVTLDSAKSTCRATIGKNDVVVNPIASRPRVEVLRRSQILALIETTPGDRYEAIRRFIDVSGVEASELSLRKLIGDLSNGRDVAVARVQENEDEIRRSWDTAGKPGSHPITWAEAEVNRGANVFDTEISAITSLQVAYNRLTEYPKRLETAQQSLTTAQNAVSADRILVEKVIQGISQDAGEMIGVLRAARDYFVKYPSPAACPVCESSERTADLSNRIDQRLSNFSSLQTAQANVTASEQLVQRTEQQLRSLQDIAMEHAAAFQKCGADQAWPSDIELPSSPVPSDPSGLQGWLQETSSLPGEWKKAEAARHDKKQFVNVLTKALSIWRDNTQAQKDLDRLLPRLQRALDIMEEQRRKFTDDVLSAISDEIGCLYEAVHPGEGLSKISLELDPKKRASLEIGASFYGQDTSPQAYFSDSHLDTLGLCVFLALSTLDQPENTILILDDVLASVDEPHVERLIEMLYAEAMKFSHCVITTHYRPWKQKLRWGWLQNGQCHFVELTKWTASDGLALVRSVPDIEKLRQLLAESPPDPQLVCAKAGVILEAALDFLTLHYECAVPRRTGGLYTLGDLLPAINKKLREALRIEVLTGEDSDGVAIYKTVSLTPILDELRRVAQTRNVFGAHFNELSFDLLDTDALGFGQKVLDLLEVLTDKDAGWPRSGKSGEYWASAGETRRLYPFKKPA